MRKLMILAAAAVTAMAMMAMATSAQAHHALNHVEVSDASTGEPCPVLNGPFDGGCFIEDMWGEYTIDGTTCEHTYDLRIGPDGEFYAGNHSAWAVFGCRVVPCDQGTVDDPWLGRIGLYQGQVVAGTDVCFDAGGATYEWQAGGWLTTVNGGTETEYDIPTTYPMNNGYWTFQANWQGVGAIEVVQGTS